MIYIIAQSTTKPGVPPTQLASGNLSPSLSLSEILAANE